MTTFYEKLEKIVPSDTTAQEVGELASAFVAEALDGLWNEVVPSWSLKVGERPTVQQYAEVVGKRMAHKAIRNGDNKINKDTYKVFEAAILLVLNEIPGFTKAFNDRRTPLCFETAEEKNATCHTISVKNRQPKVDRLFLIFLAIAWTVLPLTIVFAKGCLS